MATTTSANETKKLQVTELDFDQIKTNLKNFLRNQAEFADFDFEGSGMSVLLDLLAYNTHYLGFNANMLANEMFLDSAALRSSVVSLSKMLGYTPASAIAPEADITVVLANASGASVTMPAGTKFTTTVSDTQYTYVTNADKTITPQDGVYTFSNVKIYEGTRITFQYTADSNNEDQKFIVPNANADITTLKVDVQNSSSDTTQFTYTKATSLTGVAPDSRVYFTQEVEDGKFEVYFGDGAVGKKIQDGNIVKLTYIVTNKTLSNGANSFSLSGTIAGFSAQTITVNSKSAGGAEPESIASVKINAPLQYSSQDRAVTVADYKTLVKQIYPAANAIQVWGGEDNSTPQYGKVFISVKLADGSNLTSVDKTDIETQLGQYAVASVRPTLVDPETTFIVLNTNFKYNSNLTTKDSTTLASEVSTALSNYSLDTLNNFVGVFRYSVATGVIDDTDSSIVSNITTVKIYQKFTPLVSSTASQKYTISFNNAIYNPHTGHNSDAGGVVSTTGFKLDNDNATEYYFNDDGAGNIRLYHLVDGAVTYDNNNWGTVNYSTGEIVISSAKITAVSEVDGATSTQVRVTVIPRSNDIAPVRGQVLNIDTANSTIEGSVDTIESGSSSSGVGYSTSTSYSTSTGGTSGTY